MRSPGRAPLGQSASHDRRDAYRALSGRTLASQPYGDLVTLLDLVLTGDPAAPIPDVDPARLEAYAAAVLGRL